MLIRNSIQYGASPAPSAYAGVAGATMAKRADIVAQFDGLWPGYGGQTFASDQLAVSKADLGTKVAALSTADLSQWHRIRLDSTQSAAAWTNARIDLEGAKTGTGTSGAYFGGPKDRSSAGGGLLIESSDVDNRVLMTGLIVIGGFRGLHIRRVKFTNTASAPGLQETAQTITIQRNTTTWEAPVVRIEDCDFGTNLGATPGNPLVYGVAINQTNLAEQLDIINCRFDGCQAGVRASAVRYSRVFGCDFKQINVDAMIFLGAGGLISAINSAWDNRTIWWTRLNTMRHMSDLAALSALHTDFEQNGAPSDVNSYTVLHEFDVSYAERVTGTDARFVTYAANPTAGATISINGTTFTYVSAAGASTEITIGGTLAATLANAKTVIEAFAPTGLQRIDAKNTVLEINCNLNELGTIAASVGAIGSASRYTGGTQFQYKDDSTSPYAIDAVTICCIGTASDGIINRFWNGTSIADRCTFGRPGDMPADATVPLSGFTSDQDFEVYATSDRDTTATTKNHKYLSCVMGNILDKTDGALVNRTADGTYLSTNGVLEIEGLKLVTWKKGSAPGTQPSALMAGTFGTDSFGRVRYDFADTGAETPQAVREALYDQLKLANAGDRANGGSTDPRTWPTI